ncbi:MAG: YggS family pyridoxal phosphate-dependent enzyme [Propionibacteriales bacterium]|nr:YggS family pyridoxal phosphate-dependent enzyme [Propionibacteriales bacterium]
MSRREEVAAGLDAVRRRIVEACREAGRDESGVHLVVVTKTFPAADVRVLAELGVTDVGESRHPEAMHKHSECAGLGLTWHFAGALQTNKAADVARYTDVLHSVDRPRLVDALARAVHRSERRLRCLVQVNLDPPGEQSGRIGAKPEDVPALADRLAAVRLLEIAGVMGIAPLGRDPAPAFERLAGVAEDLRERHPGATMISAGMSGDLEAAVRYGATHVRVGGAVLGERPLLR